MGAKEFLSEGYRAIELINSYKAEIDSLAAGLSSCNVSEKVQSSPVGDNIPRLVEKIDLLRAKRAKEFLRLFEVQEQIGDVIELVENKDERLLLRLRYVNYRDWPDIACQLGYSERHIQRLHSRALLSVELILSSFSIK